MKESEENFEHTGEGPEVLRERIKNVYRAFTLMEGRAGRERYESSPKKYPEVFDDPLAKKLPEVQDLLKEEQELLDSGVSKDEIIKISNFNGKIYDRFWDIKHKLIGLERELGTQETAGAMNEVSREIYRERKELEK